jgi:general secretion pathway protein G
LSDTWKGPYLKKKSVPSDPWGSAYIYVAPGVHNPESYDLSSLGADKVESADDIVNWVKAN